MSHWPEAMNQTCHCISLDEAALQAALESQVGLPGLFSMIRERCPFVFSARPVFVASTYCQRMADMVCAIDAIAAMPGWREAVMANTPSLLHQPAIPARGVFSGYDFHLHGDRLGLIEINTNAGGAMLNAVLARAQRACCIEVEGMLPTESGILHFEQQIVAMFRQEWQLSGMDRPLNTIAIVDDNPDRQYLYPEFLLFRQLFERHGLQAVICDPAELVWREGRLWHNGRVIDMVYNRLTDFTLEEPAHAHLQQAWLQQAVVLTPHPQAHALYADKRNLALLTDTGFLKDIGVSEDVRHLLQENIPHTIIVRSENAGYLWQQRKQLFFKPWAGYGSKAAYRGDKITQRVWQEILQGGYVAQALVAPGERSIAAETGVQTLKFDIRNYAYNGEVQWLAARLYQGQTTNFRTPGGGFAPVFSTSQDQGLH